MKKTESETNHLALPYANLPANIRELFENINFDRIYETGQIIYQQEDYAEQFFYLKKGKVQIYVSSKDGFEKTLAIVTPGAILGEAAFFDEMPRVSSAKALVDSTVLSINRSLLLRLFGQHPDLAFEFLKLQARSIRILSSQLGSLTFLQADSRIARILLESAESGKTGRFVSMTHDEIGSSASVSRVTVSKILGTFTKAGIIETKYRKILLKDLNRLTEIAAY